MGIFQSVMAARLLFALGIINVVTGVLVALTCRCIPGWRLTSGLMKHKGYQRFYRYHCYIWWIFWASVIAHAVFAIGVFGVPS